MITRAQKVRLGIFVLVATGLLLGMLAVLVGTRLGERRVTYYARFEETVSGLEVGAPVKYHGVRVGSVDSIHIDRKTVSDVIVALSLDFDTPIKEDTVVVLNTMGITGLKFLELTGGTPESDFLEPESFIESGPSLISRLTGKADVITEKVELLVNNLVELTSEKQQERINQTLAELSEAARTLNDTVGRNAQRIDSILADFTEITADIRRLSADAEERLDQLQGSIEDVEMTVEEMAAEASLVLEEQNANLSMVLHNVNDSITAARELLEAPATRRIPRRIDETIAAATKLVAGADSHLGRVARAVSKSSESLNNLLSDPRVDTTLQNVAHLTTSLDGLVQTLDLTVRQSREDLFKTLGNLQDVVRNLYDFTQMLLENPSILLRGSQLEERDL